MIAAPTIRLLTGAEWQLLDAGRRNAYVESAFRHWRRRGFPHYEFDAKKVRRHFAQVQAAGQGGLMLAGGELQYSGVGLALANSFHPQMWSARCEHRRTPVECFEDDDVLRDCIRRALQLWPTRRGASPPVLRDMLRTHRRTRRVSNFRPTAAKVLIERHSRPGDSVLDFSAGYGGRLLGCMTLDRRYTGLDPSREQVRGNRAMARRLAGLGLGRCDPTVHRVPAEDGMRGFRNGEFDLVFTSPPYFDLEKYGVEPTQSYLRYPSYEQWVSEFLATCIAETHRVLRRGGTFLLNVADRKGRPIASDALRLGLERFELTMRYRLRMSMIPQVRANGQVYRHEPIFAFRKPG